MIASLKMIFYHVHDMTNHDKITMLTMLKINSSKLLMYYVVMPPTLKKLMGHIAFWACVGACVRGCVTLFVPTVTFKPLKLES